MRNSIIPILILSVSLIACGKKPISINKDLLTGNWISVKDRFDNIFYLTIEDELMLENIFDAIDPVVSYKLSFDTLIIFPKDYDKFPVIKTKVYKLKITTLDSLNMSLLPFYPNLMDTLFFKKTSFAQKNNFKIERLEFSSSPCFGRCPCQDLLIDKDSVLYHFGYGSFSKHKGYSQHKLSPKEFQRILTRLNSIEKDDFKLCSPAPDAQHFHLFLKTANDSIEIDGMFCKELTQELKDLISYLNFIERFIPLDSIKGNGPTLKYKYNKDNFFNNN